MQIFTPKNSFADRVNFVDKNNVVVGYDLTQDCCEHADWFISETRRNDTGDDKKVYDNKDLEDYVFDKSCLCENIDSKDEEYSGVRFRLVNSEGKELFLHLFNVHNGYYSHGFDVKENDFVLSEGSL